MYGVIATFPKCVDLQLPPALVQLADSNATIKKRNGVLCLQSKMKVIFHTYNGLYIQGFDMKKERPRLFEFVGSQIVDFKTILRGDFLIKFCM